MQCSRIAIPACLAAIAGLLVPSIADGKPRRGLVYAGATVQDMPFSLELTRSGKRVVSASMFVDGECDDGKPIRYYATIEVEAQRPQFVAIGDHRSSGGRIARTGRFSASGIGSEPFGDVEAIMSERLTGRVRRGTAQGTYRAEITMVDGAGQTRSSCTTGTLKWGARSERGRFFAGLTDLDMPVVVELDRARRSVEDLRIGWGALCTPPETGAWLVPDHLVDFRLTSGAFGATFQQPFDVEGLKRTFDYAVDGSVRNGTASGTLAVKVTDTDAAGAAVSTCDTGPISWSARSG
jgi:hypothetical protein